MVVAPKRRDILELFGHFVGDQSTEALADRTALRCPIINGTCLKTVRETNDRGVTIGQTPLGTCSGHEVNPHGGVILCPIRMHGNRVLFAKVSEDAFGIENPKILDARQYLGEPQDCVVALGRGSGTEIQILNADGTKMSYDWILAHVKGTSIASIAALEVQAVDITQNYRAALNAHMSGMPSPGSSHGYNQANVFKRLISQLIPKGKAISTSHLARGGLYFAVPDKLVPYFSKKLGGILNSELQPGPDVLSVVGVGIDLESYVPGRVMDLSFTQPIRAQIDSVAAMTMRGVGSQGPAIDQAVRKRLGF